MGAALALILALHLPPPPAPRANVCAVAPWGGRLELANIMLTGAGKVTSTPPASPVGQFDFSNPAQSGLLTLIR